MNSLIFALFVSGLREFSGGNELILICAGCNSGCEFASPAECAAEEDCYHGETAVGSSATADKGG